jgi:hypothetical protein
MAMGENRTKRVIISPREAVMKKIIKNRDSS